MCGISGFIDFSFESDLGLLRKMIACLQHRGPDGIDAQIFCNQTCKIGLAHSRLAIIDLTTSASQPMSSGDLCIVFNGEIYNYQELQAELRSAGYQFATNSDTEVILHAFTEWGTSAVNRFIGMFAFCLFDRRTNQAFLVRDRTGIKPLYFFQGANTWLFASELKSFHECPAFAPLLNFSQVYRYFQLGIISNDECIYNDCRQVGAGEIWTLDLKTRSINIEKYWSPTDFYHLPKLDASYEESVEQLDSLFKSACEYRMVADVPVGVFLSGGIDSSAVAAVLQANRSTRLKTFTIGFEHGNNEAPFAKEIANYLGTDHTELYCTDLQAQKIVPELPDIYDEPFSDSSAIATVLVSRLARQSVKVALSADGGDELFGGYKSYQLLNRTLSRIRLLPDFARKGSRSLAYVIGRLAGNLQPRLGHLVENYCQSMVGPLEINGQRLHVLSGAFPNYYLSNMFSKDFLQQLPTDACAFSGWDHLTALEGAQLYDYQNYLKDDILVKVDRASMSASLEGREPILDHRLFEFAARIPDSYKLGMGQSKRLLKSVAYKYIPQRLLDRPKSGFSVPISHWLRNSLADYFRYHCSEEQLASVGIFNTEFLTKQLGLFRKNQLYYSHLVWRLLVFQSWLSRWKPRIP